MKRRNLKTAISSFLISVIIFVIASFMIVMIIYEGLFTRVDEYEYSSFMTYEDMDKYYSGREVTFDSVGNSLYGRIYGEDISDKLVIVGHSKGNTGENMMAEAQFFLDNGFSVMVFDLTGHGKSDGSSQVGLQRAVSDFEKAIEFVKAEGYSELYLYGTGISGYASAACADIEGVKAVASVSAFSSVSDMTLEYAVENMSILGYVEYPVMMLYQYFIFGSELEKSAVKGINNSDVPVVVINGTADDSIKYDGAALINAADEITNQNVIYKSVEEGRHDSLMRSADAVALLDRFNADAYELYNEYGGSVPVAEIEAIYGRYDREAMSELDYALMNEILSVFISVQ